jgi:hypothetical protein
MTEEMWRARPRPRVTIEGLDGCLDLFGAEPAAPGDAEAETLPTV